MPKYKKIRFVIDGYTPMTLPLNKAVEYLRNFAGLAGDAVHFSRVGKGSAALECIVEENADLPEIITRMSNAALGTADVEANRSYIGLRDLLNSDGTTGKIKVGRCQVIAFKKIESAPKFTVTEECSLEGILIKIGGKGETVPVQIQDADMFYTCNASREKAKELARYIFGDPIRLSGLGRWQRTERGQWELENFQISSFEELNAGSIQQTFDNIRMALGNMLENIDDPLKELEIIRHGSFKAV